MCSRGGRGRATANAIPLQDAARSCTPRTCGPRPPCPTTRGRGSDPGRSPPPVESRAAAARASASTPSPRRTSPRSHWRLEPGVAWRPAATPRTPSTREGRRSPPRRRRNRRSGRRPPAARSPRGGRENPTTEKRLPRPPRPPTITPCESLGSRATAARARPCPQLRRAAAATPPSRTRTRGPRPVAACGERSGGPKDEAAGPVPRAGVGEKGTLAELEDVTATKPRRAGSFDAGNRNTGVSPTFTQHTNRTTRPTSNAARTPPERPDRGRACDCTPRRPSAAAAGTCATGVVHDKARNHLISCARGVQAERPPSTDNGALRTWLTGGEGGKEHGGTRGSERGRG